MNLKGSKTAKNLMKAFAGESQARNRYTFFASVAKKEGYIQIQNVFLETAAQEKEHAEIFFKFLANGEVNGEAIRVEADYPVSLYATTADNLVAAAQGEEEEADLLYPEFAKVAEEEGFLVIAERFRMIAKIERFHQKRYQHFLKLLKEGKLYHNDHPSTWQCKNCGHIHEGNDAPGVCPVCNHPQGWFEVI